MSEIFTQAALDYQRIEKALTYLAKNFRRQPELGKIAEIVGLSEFHFQRMFKRWVGISPKRFLQFLTKEHAKKLLAESDNLLEVTYNTGLSSAGRLHDLFVTCDAVTPGNYKNKGLGLKIQYGFHLCPFGECLLGITDRGICALFFIVNENRKRAVDLLHSYWPSAEMKEKPKQTESIVEAIFNPKCWNKEQPFQLLLQGTNFQLKVWEALLRIPCGKLTSYEDIARVIGKPKALRAVGNAVARNPISYLIPCHRVIRKLGDLGNYQGGVARKKALLGWEMTENYSQNKEILLIK